MTLKEKFQKLYLMKYQCISAEQIADEFAIGFADWLLYEWVCDERWSKITDPKELLEIYKKTL